ncbi:hypothetical protein Tco_1210318 [Tanacetum coccineum]
MAVPKDHLKRFHGMDDAKEIWAAIKTRFGGNANSKKMQKSWFLKQRIAMMPSDQGSTRNRQTARVDGNMQVKGRYSRPEGGKLVDGQDFKPVRTDKGSFVTIDAGYNDIPLYSRFKQGYMGLKPQSPSPIESDASSTVSSTCQSNDSDGEQGTVSDHSVNDDPIPMPSSEQVSTSIQRTQPQVPKPQQTVDPSCAQHVKTPRQPIRTQVTPSTILP